MTKETNPWKSIAIGALLACALMGGLIVWDTPPSSNSVVWSAEEQRIQEEDIYGPGLELGSVAPDFALPTAAGDSVRLKELLGRCKALIFVSAQCPYCEKLAEKLAGLQRNAEELVLICTGETQTARHLQESHELPFPVLVDRTGEVYTTYQIQSVPTVYVLDEQGRVTAIGRGFPRSWKRIRELDL